MSLHPATLYPGPGLLQCGLQLQNYNYFFQFTNFKNIFLKISKKSFTYISPNPSGQEPA